jgi:UDPglucose--hexose-1-phosphate uridylyltransferase
MPEFRKDPVLDRWVIIAAARAQRPQIKREWAPTADPEICPFCAGNENMTPPAVLVLGNNDSRLNTTNWSLRVVPNKYPAFVADEDWSRNDGLYQSMNATGIHEVVIESSKHVVDVAALSASDVERILHAYQQRMIHLRRDSRWRYILIYKNQGIEAGATLLHIHSQITALPVVPKGPRKEIKAAKQYYAAVGRCIYCDVVQREHEIGIRIIAENKRYVVFCPFASRVAGEMWILPRRHLSCFESSTTADLRALAHLVRDALTRLARRFHGPGFNYFIHSNPLGAPENPHYHWHLEILPRLQYFAAFESGAGLYMNSMAPEDAARLLREVVI